jgi:hypothetical protein
MTNKDEILHEIQKKGEWVVIIRPLKYEGGRLGLNECESIIKKYRVSLRGWDYPHFHEGGHNYGGLTCGQNYVQCVTNYKQYKELWRMYQSAQFFHRFACIEDWIPDSENDGVLSIYNTLYRATEIYEFASRLAASDVFDEQLHLSISIRNMMFLERPRKLIFKISQTLAPMEYTYSDNYLPYTKNLSKVEIVANAHGLAIEYLHWLFQRFHWQSSNVKDVLKTEQEKFLKGEY